MKNKNKERLINISLLLLISVLCLFLGEIFVRMFIPQKVEEPLDIFAADKGLDWKLKANFTKKYSYPGYEMLVTTNQWGFRGIPHDYAKGDNIFRIAGIGDSFLFGYGVNYEKSVLAVLEEMMSGQNPAAGRIETINLGVPAYCPDQYYKILTGSAVKYAPDLVIVFFYSNDWMEGQDYSQHKVSPKGFLLTGERFSFTSIRSFLLPLRVFLKRNSQLYVLARGNVADFLRRKKLMGVAEIELYRKDYDFNQKFSYTFSRLDKINIFCRDRLGCPLIICIIPEILQVSPARREIILAAHHADREQYDWQKPPAALKNFCRDKGIFCLDLLPVFLKAEGGQEHYFDINPHWNEQGHLLAAREIFEFIKENNIIKSP